MKYPIFASVVMFSLWLMFAIRRRRDREESEYQSFWDEEAKANSTRKKPLDDLNYITIPFDRLPTDLMADDPEVSECLDMLHTLAGSPIVNFTGLSNTQLKLKYGAPNIELLSAYDQSYTLMVRELDKWAHILYKNDHPDEARTILEFAVDTGSDVSSTYELLSTIYDASGKKEKIKELIPKAEALNSLMRKSILNKLNDHLQ